MISWLYRIYGGITPISFWTISSSRRTTGPPNTLFIVFRLTSFSFTRLWTQDRTEEARCQTFSFLLLYHVFDPLSVYVFVSPEHGVRIESWDSSLTPHLTECGWTTMVSCSFRRLSVPRCLSPGHKGEDLNGKENFPYLPEVFKGLRGTSWSVPSIVLTVEVLDDITSETSIPTLLWLQFRSPISLLDRLEPP